MTGAETVLTVVTLGGSILGAGFRASMKLTRLVDAVERLTKTMESTVGDVSDLKVRVGRLEAK